MHTSISRQIDMKYRQTDNQPAVKSHSKPAGGPQHLADLRQLPRRLYGHRESLPNRAISQRHHHPWAQLSYAVRGVIEVETPTGRFVAPPSRAVWIPAGHPHGVRCSQGTEIRSLYVAPAACGEDWSDCQILKVQPLLRELIRAFGELPVAYDEDGPAGRLVEVLLDRLTAAPSCDLGLPWPTDTRLRRLCQRLRDTPDDRRTLSDHAHRLGVSERTLSRAFLAQTGLGFRRWRQRCRLLAALPELEQGERVTDVALTCGYDSLSAFISAFREQFGTTPGELLRSSSGADQSRDLPSGSMPGNPTTPSSANS